MKKEITVEYDNIALVVVGEYQKGQDGSYMYPDFSSDFNCFKVLCGGQDIIDILEQEVIDELENQAIEIIEEKW
jgi:hypothetical protein|tara:strand:+ start:558 stop:779 length:222 start_codon:yes stop_codon:yes gene_type:complete